MFTPDYEITENLIKTSRLIGEKIGKLNTKHLTETVYAKLRERAREVSTYASTSIEGNPLTLSEVRNLLQTNFSEQRDFDTEVLNYNKALDWLYKHISSNKFSITHTTICKIQEMVVSGLLDNPSEVGRYRGFPVLIRDSKVSGGVVYMAPDVKDVRPLMDDLVSFVTANRGNLDPIILAGLFHKQLVIIHPFTDGNGRTTRLLTTGLLADLGIDLFNIFSFENYYNDDVSEYFRYVGVRGDYYDILKKGGFNFTEWLEYFSDGILTELVRVEELISRQAIRLDEHHKKIIHFIEKNGSITMRDYSKLTDRKLGARKQDFQYLIDSKFIVRKGKGRAVRYELL